jgi:hypothetical protein
MGFGDRPPFFGGVPCWVPGGGCSRPWVGGWRGLGVGQLGLCPGLAGPGLGWAGLGWAGLAPVGGAARPSALPSGITANAVTSAKLPAEARAGVSHCLTAQCRIIPDYGTNPLGTFAAISTAYSRAG